MQMDEATLECSGNASWFCNDGDDDDNDPSVDDDDDDNDDSNSDVGRDKREHAAKHSNAVSNECVVDGSVPTRKCQSMDCKRDVVMVWQMGGDEGVDEEDDVNNNGEKYVKDAKEEELTISEQKQEDEGCDKDVIFSDTPNAEDDDEEEDEIVDKEEGSAKVISLTSRDTWSSSKLAASNGNSRHRNCSIASKNAATAKAEAEAKKQKMDGK